jgi:hypothetical protein
MAQPRILARKYASIAMQQDHFGQPLHFTHPHRIQQEERM